MTHGYSVASAAVSEQLRPVWILENQQRRWLGGWEPTAETTRSSWFGNIGNSPPPFEAFEEQSGPPLSEEQLGFSRSELRRHVYPVEGGAPETPSRESGEGVMYGPCAGCTTDEEGWTYSTAWVRQDERRRGGRAAPRHSDHCRRRWWRLGLPPPSAPRASFLSTLEDHKSRAFDSLSDAFAEVYGRRSLGEKSMALSPVAALRRRAKDTADYEALCSQLPAWTDTEALGELCVASLYARAAYGFTARMGKIDSLMSGGLTFSVQRHVFDYAEHVDDASNSQSFLDMMGLQHADIVCAQWRACGTFHPVYVVVRDHLMQWILVVVRGTLSMKDVLADVAAKSVPFLEGHAHEGFVKCTEHILGAIEGTAHEELNNHPGYKLVFCGHSMGGAVASLAAAALRERCSWAASCIAIGIGTPGVFSALVGDRLAREKVVYTVVNGRDWSPRTSLTNVNQLVDDLCDLSMVRSALRTIAGGTENDAGPIDMLNEQLPPGLILQLVPGEARLFGKSVSLQLLLASGANYRHSTPVWPDVEAHLPICYVRNLLRGLQVATLPTANSTTTSTDITPAPLPSLQAWLSSCSPRLVAIQGALARIASPSTFGDDAAILPDWIDEGKRIAAEYLEASRAPA
eukprot:TRINITY_DN71998_c0_g1_i1.p1 TRINITY_DN71998_c0_g1~~TRINITY_DN71998_c0_g1_i1.p1  ORF type:complete len:630 (-),score=85.19 TRINITY_DN71998_c0_g1_i1:162-2051(-)